MCATVLAVDGDRPMRRLRVSDNGHYLVTDDGHPFFWMGDTSWQLIRKSRREDATDQPAVEKYFSTRERQGFNVLQTVVCAPSGRMGGQPNAYGFAPFADVDCTQPKLGPGPNDDYWDHVDYVLKLAQRHGFRVVLLPLWLNSVDNGHPWVAAPKRAYDFGRFLGERYRDLPHIVWTMGGDPFKRGRNVDNPTRLALTRALAEGIADGVNGGASATYDGEADWTTTFMAFHPPGGGRSSSEFIAAEPWVDMNLIQTTTMFEFANFATVGRDYRRTPSKPTLDCEVAYEESTTLSSEEDATYGKRLTTDWEVRKAAYWAVLAGACGHTYGHRSLISWLRFGEKGTFGAASPWYEKLDTPGALQMHHLKMLLAPLGVDRMPADDLLVDNPEDAGYAVATRGVDGRHALVYLPTGKTVRVKVGTLAHGLVATWVDPRTGARRPIGPVGAVATSTFTPPTSGGANDWVLELTSVAASPGPQDPGQ